METTLWITLLIVVMIAPILATLYAVSTAGPPPADPEPPAES
jgi:hypothetical protein